MHFGLIAGCLACLVGVGTVGRSLGTPAQSPGEDLIEIFSTASSGSTISSNGIYRMWPEAREDWSAETQVVRVFDGPPLDGQSRLLLLRPLLDGRAGWGRMALVGLVGNEVLPISVRVDAVDSRTNAQTSRIEFNRFLSLQGRYGIDLCAVSIDSSAQLLAMFRAARGGQDARYVLLSRSGIVEAPPREFSSELKSELSKYAREPERQSAVGGCTLSFRSWSGTGSIFNNRVELGGEGVVSIEADYLDEDYLDEDGEVVDIYIPPDFGKGKPSKEHKCGLR